MLNKKIEEAVEFALEKEQRRIRSLIKERMVSFNLTIYILLI